MDFQVQGCQGFQRLQFLGGNLGEAFAPGGDFLGAGGRTRCVFLLGHSRVAFAHGILGDAEDTADIDNAGFGHDTVPLIDGWRTDPYSASRNLCAAHTLNDRIGYIACLSHT